MANSRVELAQSMAEAGEATNVREIQIFTQKGLYARRIMDHMGLADLNRKSAICAQTPEYLHAAWANSSSSDAIFCANRSEITSSNSSCSMPMYPAKRLREEMLRSVKLSNVEHRNFRLIQEMVYKMAKKLSTLHSRRRKIFKRGQLNVPKTLRNNMSYDGAIFDLYWKSVKVDRPKVFAICDVSGSVANYARFMLMFLYSMDEVMPKVRSFVFSSDLAEVTELFNRNKLEDAISKTLHDYSGGSTDYGQALLDFKKLCLDDVDNRTTIIILGDARNNHGEAHAEVLKELYDRSKRIIWLNPEETGVEHRRFRNAQVRGVLASGGGMQFANALRARGQQFIETNSLICAPAVLERSAFPPNSLRLSALDHVDYAHVSQPPTSSIFSCLPLLASRY